MLSVSRAALIDVFRAFVIQRVKQSPSLDCNRIAPHRMPFSFAF